MKKVLMIAYHYPPNRGGSGILRTLKFSRYLTEYGWLPIVLTANPRAYPKVGDDQIDEIPDCVQVKRAFALDAARHLSIKGAYPRCTALPDRWASWWLGAVPSGLRIIREQKPAVIWSTYPIATAHLIALTLHRLSGIPWIADFRDPMIEEGYPNDPYEYRIYRWIERQTVNSSRFSVFTTPGTMRRHVERHGNGPRTRWTVIPNGYDEEDFAAIEWNPENARSPSRCMVLIHNGLLYPVERDPRPFFAAVGDLYRAGSISPSTLKIVLRGSGNEDSYRDQLRRYGIEEIVFLKESIPYRDALGETISADGLLLFQASVCNDQIPAKLYEYMRARRPILALTDLNGDTAWALKDAGIDTIAPWDSKEAIAKGLLDFIGQIRDGRAPVAGREITEGYSRKALAGKLAGLLDSVTG